MNMIGQLVNRLEELLGELLVGMARFYQLAISPLLGAHCRYEPSCSEYFIQSVRQRGVLFGLLGGLWRICRCHPWAKGGYDPVLEEGTKAQRHRAEKITHHEGHEEHEGKTKNKTMTQIIQKDY